MTWDALVAVGTIILALLGVTSIFVNLWVAWSTRNMAESTQESLMVSQVALKSSQRPLLVDVYPGGLRYPSDFPMDFVNLAILRSDGIASIPRPWVAASWVGLLFCSVPLENVGVVPAIISTVRVALGAQCIEVSPDTVLVSCVIVAPGQQTRVSVLISDASVRSVRDQSDNPWIIRLSVEYRSSEIAESFITRLVIAKYPIEMASTARPYGVAEVHIGRLSDPFDETVATYFSLSPESSS